MTALPPLTPDSDDRDSHMEISSQHLGDCYLVFIFISEVRKMLAKHQEDALQEGGETRELNLL